MKQSFKLIITIFFTILCAFSCSTKKDILLLQDKVYNKAYNFNQLPHKIKSDDILKIDISSSIPEVTFQFNNAKNTTMSTTLEVIQLNGYTVDNSGIINLPSIGNIKVAGLTINECRDFIYKTLLDNGVLQNHYVDVKVINFNLTILGEVTRPGNYNYIDDNMNILKAIGLAGGLTINGKRKDVRVMRKDSNGKMTVSQIDLTDVNTFKSPFFKIKSNDIIIVNPNSSRVKNAGIIGNSGTLLSLLTFLLSSIIVINN